MKLAFYKGNSLVSHLIRWKTRGPYSHVAVMFDNGGILEAWQGSDSVRWIDSLSDGHTPGTAVDVYSVNVGYDELDAYLFARSKVGQPYGYRTVLKFLTYTSGDDPASWICSEIALEVVRKAGVDLLSRVDAYKVSPVMLSWSPLLTLEKTVVTQ